MDDCWCCRHGPRWLLWERIDLTHDVARLNNGQRMFSEFKRQHVLSDASIPLMLGEAIKHRLRFATFTSLSVLYQMNNSARLARTSHRLLRKNNSATQSSVRFGVPEPSLLQSSRVSGGRRSCATAVLPARSYGSFKTARALALVARHASLQAGGNAWTIEVRDR